MTTFRLVAKRKLKALKQTTPTTTLKEVINPKSTKEAHITDAKVNYVAADVDTATEVATALNTANTTLNTLLSQLESYGILRSS